MAALRDGRAVHLPVRSEADLASEAFVVVKNGEVTSGTDGVPLLRITAEDDPGRPAPREPVVRIGGNVLDLSADDLREVFVWQPGRRDGEPTGDWRVHPVFWSRPAWRHYKREAVWKQVGQERAAANTSKLIEELEKAKSQPLRSEEHTSELQSRGHLVCRLLLEKKKTEYYDQYYILHQLI